MLVKLHLLGPHVHERHLIDSYYSFEDSKWLQEEEEESELREKLQAERQAQREEFD